MSPRPKRITDSELILAATRVAIRRGPEHTRLADVALESGLAPATLIQRFGSREGVLDAVGTAVAGEVAAAFRSIQHPDTALVATALASIDVASHLAFFAGRRAAAPAYSRELRKQIAFMLGRGVETGWIAPCDIAALARRIQLGFLGMTMAALLEQTSVGADDIAGMIDEVISGYL